jgi:hypothetical protein
MREPADKSLLTDVFRLRSHPCTTIASITSDGIREEGDLLRDRGLTWDIRDWVERSETQLDPDAGSRKELDPAYDLQVIEQDLGHRS